MSAVSPDEVLDDLDALLAESLAPALEESDITIVRLRARAKVSETKAREMLAQWMDERRIIYLGRRRSSNGRTVEAWRISEPKKTK